jgi:hypothetical protein
MSEQKICVDLCAGLEGFSRTFKKDPSWKVITVDFNPKFNPTVCADVTTINWKEFQQNILEGKQPDFLCMGPPCERNSIACSQWSKPGIGKALSIVGACLEAVIALKPKAWLLENPKGRLRWFMPVPPKSTINYCDYDQFYRTVKATDLWGNVSLPMVVNQRPLKIGHVEKSWFRKGWGWDIPRDAAHRAEMPEGFSLAVKKAVEEKITSVGGKT